MHLILRGEIRTGVGNFSYWLDKLEPYYTRKTGMRLFPGTLNVHLTSGSYPTPANALRLEKEEYRWSSFCQHRALQDHRSKSIHPSS